MKNNPPIIPVTKLTAFGITSDNISQVFDARGMPCPMPLLKAKVALRSVAEGDALYLLASDKNSQTDLVAFCQKNAYQVHTWISSDNDNCTIYHFIIQKSS